MKSAGFCTTDVAEESDLFHWKFQDNSKSIPSCLKSMKIGYSFSMAEKEMSKHFRVCFGGKFSRVH